MADDVFMEPSSGRRGPRGPVLVQVPEGWAPLADIAKTTSWGDAGLKIRSRANSYATGSVGRVLAWAGSLAAARGGKLQIADISRSAYFTKFPPHLSHMVGRDVDVGYTLDRYPTPTAVPASPSFAWLLCQLRPYLSVVFVSTARMNELKGAANLQGCTLPNLQTFRGHTTHAHLRFREKELSLEENLGDDDGQSTAQDYFLPDVADDGGWTGPATGYPYVRAVLDNYTSAPEQLQEGSDKSQPSPASLQLAVRAYDWFRYYHAPNWPGVHEACKTPGSNACQFYGAAARYFHAHETAT